jgi:membrane fusion protein, copper/silver efflux system
MKTTFFSNKYFKGGAILAAGLFLGWLFFHHNQPAQTGSAEVQQAGTPKEIWTCSMHPQIKMDKPGQCPICGMDLIPLVDQGSEIDDQAIEMSESAVKLAEVQTTIVGKGSMAKEVRLFGKIQPDEKLRQSQTAHFPGRIEKLLVNTTGETIRKGQLIAKVYSPELVSAQKELLEAISMKDQFPSLADAAREKLRQWKLTGQQIEEIEKSGEVKSRFELFSTTSGIVTKLNVAIGDYLSKGDILYDVFDLSRVWAVFDAYESDLPWLKVGQSVGFTAQALPGKSYNGNITFIDPVVDASTRITKVRVEMANPGLVFKPEMFVNGVVQSANNEGNNQLSILTSAVLWTGKRSVVYVKVPGTSEPSFKMREVTLGRSVNDGYIIEDGLAEGEEIVVNGAFSVDAAAQLAGKTSMMNQPESGKVSEGFTQSEALTKLAEATIKVAGKCEMCKDRIETTARSIKGVTFAEWSVEQQRLLVRFNNEETSSDAIQKKIASVGHDTEKYRASDEVYKNLPECCLYERLKY